MTKDYPLSEATIQVHKKARPYKRHTVAYKS